MSKHRVIGNIKISPEGFIPRDVIIAATEHFSEEFIEQLVRDGYLRPLTDDEVQAAQEADDARADEALRLEREQTERAEHDRLNREAVEAAARLLAQGATTQSQDSSPQNAADSAAATEASASVAASTDEAQPSQQSDADASPPAGATDETPPSGVSVATPAGSSDGSADPVGAGESTQAKDAAKSQPSPKGGGQKRQPVGPRS